MSILKKAIFRLDPYGLVADWIGTVTSGIIGSYLLAPGYTLMELEVCAKIRELVGYPNPRTQGSGIFVPGSSTSLQFALQVALQKKIPGIKKTGLFQSGNGTLKPCFFLSTGASYAAEKGALLQGIGPSAIFKVKVDLNGRMIMHELVSEIKRAISEGFLPFLVYATAGTPQVGAVDNINVIAEIAKDFNLWLHVDASIGGGVLLTKSQRYRLAGVEKSDSFSWSITQSLALPFTAAVLVSKEKVFDETIGMGDMPVFGKPPFYNGSYDLGDSTMQNAKKADVLKFWLVWKAKGEKGLAGHINYNFANVEFAIKHIKERKKYFKLLPVDKFDLCLLSFVLIHPDVAHLDWRSKEFKKKHDVLMEGLKTRLLLDGIARISVSSFGDYPKFLTIFFNNNVLTKEDIIYLFDNLEYYTSKAYFLPDGQLTFNPIEKNFIKLPIEPSKYHPYISASIPYLHISFFVQVFKVILEHGLFADVLRFEPVNFYPPEELEKKLDLRMGKEPASHAELIKVIKQLIKYNSIQADPYYMFQLVSGRDPYSIIGDFFTAAINSPMITYEDHPIFTLIEREILKELRTIIGYPNGDGDGISTAGPSFAIQIAIAMARYSKFPKVKHVGNNAVGGNLVIFTSTKTKRAYIKAAFYSGIGTVQCVLIETTENGRMITSEFRKAVEKTIKEGSIPLLVAATIGTSIVGAIDNVDEIAAVCKEFGIWLHIDGTFGGAVVMSKREFYRFKGIEKSDSFHINFHRLFGSVAIATAIVTRHKDLIQETLSLSHSINYGNDFVRGVYDVGGDKNLETVRRADLFKVWLMWKAKGTEGLSDHIDYLFDLTKFTLSELEKHPNFKPILKEFDTTNICFHYVNDRLRPLYDKDKTSSEFFLASNNVTNVLQGKLAREGVAYWQVSSSCLECPLFFRFAVTHSGLTKEDVVHIIKQMDEIGKFL